MHAYRDRWRVEGEGLGAARLPAEHTDRRTGLPVLGRPPRGGRGAVRQCSQPLHPRSLRDRVGDPPGFGLAAPRCLTARPARWARRSPGRPAAEITSVQEGPAWVGTGEWWIAHRRSGNRYGSTWAETLRG